MPCETHTVGHPDISSYIQSTLTVASFDVCTTVSNTVECFLGNASTRRRRKQLAQLRVRLRPLDDSTCQPSGHAHDHTHDDENYRLETLASLDDNALDTLTYSVLNRHILFRSSSSSSSVTSASTSNSVQGKSVAKCFRCPTLPDHLLADLFAWFRKTPASNRDQLKRLSYLCSTEQCCNPFHYALVAIADDDCPPPYSVFDTPETSANQVKKYPQIQTTKPNINTPWCEMNYYEHKSRVASRIPITTDFMNIYFNKTNSAKNEGTNLNFHNLLENHKVNQTICEIGNGLTLWRENDCEIWICNHSDIPLFLCSPSIEINIYKKSFVQRLSPHYCIKAYDRNRTKQLNPFCHEFLNEHSPIGLSFGKGWNQGYTRPSITHCPHWIDIVVQK